MILNSLAGLEFLEHVNQFGGIEDADVRELVECVGCQLGDPFSRG